MNLIHALTRKPWEKEQDAGIGLHGGRAFSLPTAKVGLRVFLVVLTVVFLLLIVVYTARSELGDWRPLPNQWLLWPNTALLILSSVGLQWARVAANRGQIGGVKVSLAAGGGFAFAFLAGQLLVWQQLAVLGYFTAANPANASFCLVTGVHGVHLLGGLVAWGRTTAKVWRGAEVAQVRLSVEMCAVYWHYLLLIWLILFGLLFTR
jgi:cytochrome c oxidase subunit 3